MRFASDIADLGFNLLQNLEGVSRSEECRSECESESSSESESENENASKSEDESKNESDSESSKNGSGGVKEENQVFEAASDLSPDQYPLLHKLGVHSDFMDKLLQELVKYNGRNTIEYMQGNNRPGYLVPQPSLRSIKNYEAAISSKSSSFIDNIVNNITKSTSCTESEVVECLLRGLFLKHEDSFITVAVEKGVGGPLKKMDAASVEAMLCETRLNTKNSRALFKHLRLFLGNPILSLKLSGANILLDIYMLS
jgi:hypothetical protein